MLVSRRAFAGIGVIVLGVAIALAVVEQRRGDPAAADDVDGALAPSDGAGTARQTAPAGTSAPERRAAPVPAPVPERRRSAASAAAVDDAARLCARTVDDAVEFAKMEAAAFAATERNAANPLQISGFSDERLRADLGYLQRSFAGSSDPEHFLTGVLLDPPERRASDDPSAQTLLLDLGVRAADSDSPLLAWHALRACVQTEAFCPYPQLEQRLLATDRDNAEAWAFVAMLDYRRGDVAGALGALQGAGRAATSTWYWTETIAVVERALAEQTALPYRERVVTAFGSAAAVLPSYATLTRMCDVESATSRAWAEACLAFGTLRAQRNETAARGIGHAIRKRALEELGDAKGAADADAERALLAAERTAAGPLLQALIETSPARLHAYLDAVQRSGESAGIRGFLRQEVPPLFERAGLLERDGTRACVAQLLEPPARE